MSTGSFFNILSTAFQQCDVCQSGFYCVGNTSAPVVCPAETICRLGSAIPLPRSVVPNATTPAGTVASSNVLLRHSEDAAKTVVGILILVLGFGSVLLLGIVVVLVVLFLRKTHWGSAKSRVMKLDVLFSRQHANVNPGENAGLMMERKTVLGAVFSIFVIIVFLALALFLTYSYFTGYVLRIAQLPSGLADQPGNPGVSDLSSSAFSVKKVPKDLT